MNLLVLTSRYTAGRDIIGEDFGRQARLFSALKRLGHEIDFLCADYKKFEKKDVKLHGINVLIRPFSPAKFLNFLKDLKILLKSKRYDFLIATSDPLWGIIGYFFAGRHGIRFVYDLHDNYETYNSYKMPFIRHLDRYVIRHCDIVTTVSFALKDKISKIRKHNVFVLHNGVDLRLFKPVGRRLSRKRLSLPPDSKIIAYTGSLQKTLGIDVLINVFERMRKEINANAKLRLLLVGRASADSINKKGIPNIKARGIISFDALNQQEVVYAINAADAVVIPSPSNEFTKYCFPYKLVEYMACNTPIVATALGDVRLMLKGYEDSLCAPDDDEELYRKIKLQLNKGKIDYRKRLKNFAWENIALKFDRVMKRR